jgi:SAM-dependent methyltransferase
MTREELLLSGISKASRVIEIGPSYSPLAPKRQGWDAFIVDHATREELVVKYREHGKDVDRIEAVDYVWRGGSLADALPEQCGSFDAFIASHVIEHSTDVITFIQAAQRLIKPDGVIVLAVPDKRKCFDFYRHPSTTADAIAAFEDRRDRHNLRTHLDYMMQMSWKGRGPAWHQEDTRPAELLLGLEEIKTKLSLRYATEYVDAHGWVFVPASFKLMIFELTLLGYLNVRIDNLIEMPATEFLVHLRLGAESIPAEEIASRRQALQNAILVEIAEQTRQIAGSALFPAPATEQQSAPRSWKRRWPWPRINRA